MCYQLILSDGHKRTVHVDHLKRCILSTHQMLVEAEVPVGAPSSSGPIQSSTSYKPVGKTHVRDEDNRNGIEHSQHRSQPLAQQTSTTTNSTLVREEGRDRTEPSQLKYESVAITEGLPCLLWQEGWNLLLYLRQECRNLRLCLTPVQAVEGWGCPAVALLGRPKLQECNEGTHGTSRDGQDHIK